MEENKKEESKKENKTTVEDYNKENTSKYDIPKSETRKRSSKKKLKNTKKKKSSKLKLVIIYILIVILIIFAWVQYGKYQESKSLDAAVAEYGQVEIKYPLKESVTEDVLTNEQALENNVNQMIGYMEIPSVDLKAPIYQGASNADADMQKIMNYSVGHEPGSYLPGEGKQIVLTGHREEQFGALKDVQDGDVVIVIIGNNTFLYEVSEVGKVDPEGDEAVQKIRGETDEEQLVMYTCFPFAPFTPVTARYYVKADRISEYESPVEEA